MSACQADDFTVAKFTSTDLSEPQQSLVAGRRILEILVEMHRDGSPQEVINKAERALAIASAQGRTHESAARAAEFLEDQRKSEFDERTDLRELRGLLYELAAQRTYMWKGRQDLRQSYLDKAARTRFPSDAERPTIAVDDAFIGVVDDVLAAVVNVGPDAPVGNALDALRTQASFVAGDPGLAARIGELEGLVHELAGFREARWPDAQAGSEKRTRDRRDLAKRAYVRAAATAPADEDKQRVSGRHSAYHLSPHGWAAAKVDAERFSEDLQEAIDLAQVRHTLGMSGVRGSGTRFTDADLLLGLYLAEGGKAHKILSSLGVDEQTLRDAIRAVKQDLPANTTPEGLMLEAALQTAAEKARRCGYQQVGGEHLLNALATPSFRPTPASRVLAELGISPQQIRRQVDAASPDLHASASVLG
jgi:Clp amino terminal domain, pathogenicity island component